MGVTPQSYLRSAVADSIIGLHASVLINRAVKNYRFSQIMIEKTQKKDFFDLMIVNPPDVRRFHQVGRRVRALLNEVRLNERC